MATYPYNTNNMGTPKTARLNVNEIYGVLVNMIISQQVFADNIKGKYDSLAKKFKTDGTMYGDTKLFYSSDALKTRNWFNDAEAANLLSLHRPKGPEVQAVSIDQFRIVELTLDDYLSKRAWSTGGAFASFHSVMMSWMKTTKEIYEATLINSFVGTTESRANGDLVTNGVVEIDVTTPTTGLSGEEKNRVSAQTISQGLADLMVDLKDVKRDYNDYGHLRSYEESDLMVIWNSKYVNKITKVDLPTIFHKDGIFSDFSNVLPARYFGHVETSAIAKNNNDGTYRSLIEADYTTATSMNAVVYDDYNAQQSGATPNVVHVFPGDVIPQETVKITEAARAEDRTLTAGIAANEAYTVADDIICKIIHKESVPFMSAFEVSTAFWNPKSLTNNHYLIWGYSTPTYIWDKPFLTVEED